MFDPLPIHPVADLFPMLPDDELQELAEDIKQRGLLHPIVLDVKGRILDGRNRHRACGIAGVVPNFEAFDGDDPTGYVLAANINRRHLSKGQKAMIVARVRSLLGESVRSLSEHSGISTGRISQAATVLEHAPDLADAVVAGSQPLNDAYAAARDRKAAAESAEAQTAKLRNEAPDLAAAVAEERMPLNEALSAARARAEEEQRRRRVATALLCDLVVSLAKTNGSDTADLYEPELAAGTPLSEQVISDARDALDGIAETLKNRGVL